MPREGAQSRDARTLSDAERADIAASFQRVACRAITLKLGRAVAQGAERGVRYQALLTGGGVTANSRLRTELGAFAREHGLACSLPALALCMDNAAMIAGLGHHLLIAGEVSDHSLQALPTTAC